MRLIKSVCKIYTDRERERVREIKIQNKYRTLKFIKVISNYAPLPINQINLEIQN